MTSLYLWLDRNLDNLITLVWFALVFAMGAAFVALVF